MPRPVNERVWDGLLAQQTDQAYLILLRLMHPALAEPIRITSDRVHTTSRGALYVACPLDIHLPPDQERENAKVTVRISNVDREIVASLRAISEPATIEMEVVESATPDLVEAGPFEFQLSSAQYDALWVSGTLTYEPKMRNAWPALFYDPATTPGVF